MGLGVQPGKPQAEKGYRMEVPSPGKEMGFRTEMTFTIKSLVVLFLFAEEPWRMKLRLNVFVLVTEDTSILSAKRKQSEGHPELDRLSREKGQVPRLPRCPDCPGLCSGPGISFSSAGLSVALFCVYFS